MRVALIQTRPVFGEVERNLEAVRELTADLEADLVVLPELFATGYAFVSAEGVGAEPGKVDIFDLGSLERVADLEVGQQAGGIVFWRMDDGR